MSLCVNCQWGLLVEFPWGPLGPHQVYVNSENLLAPPPHLAMSAANPTQREGGRPGPQRAPSAAHGFGDVLESQ